MPHHPSDYEMDDSIASALHDIIHLLLQSSADFAETPHTSRAPRPSNEHLKKIIAAILWHRKFVLSYYVVIGAVILISGAHGVRRNIKTKSQRVSNNGTRTSDSSEHVSLSAASTLQGTITPPGKASDDKAADDKANSDLATATTPLLSRDAARPVRRPRAFDRLKSFLTHQPRPVWALTSASNVLPDNGTSLVVLLFLGINIFYLLFQAPLSVAWIFILADRAGLLFTVNLPILYILAAKNNQLLKALTGWSYEGLNLFHRRLGEWMIAFSVIHMLGMFAVWYTILYQRGYSLAYYLSIPVVFLGIAAILSYLTIYVTSVGWFRSLYYETFLGLHIFFQVAALGFLYLHYPTARPFVIATFIIWVIDRLLWRTSLSARKYVATLEIAPDNHTVLLNCDVELRRKLFGIHIGVHQGWLSGQHIFLTIPSMGFKYRFQTHPFTIASPAPPTNSNIESWPLQLVMRSIGGFSLDLLEHARHHQHSEIILDGPYGATDVLEAVHHADRVCFVAGGSGIAVTYPLAWDIVVEGVMKAESAVSTRKVYKKGSSQVNSAVPRRALAAGPGYAHIWVRQEASHQNWLTMFPRADTVKEGLSIPNYPRIPLYDKAGEGLVEIVTHTFDTRSAGSSGGRPDIGSELWSWVTFGSLSKSPCSTLPSSNSSSSSSSPDLYDSKKSDPPLQRETICIVVSGPDGLVRDVRNISAKLIRDGWDIQVWVEKFGW